MELNVKAFANFGLFQKHLKAVQFCIEHNLSYPKETSEFFRGKVAGDDIDDIKREYVLDYIKDGIEIDLPKEYEDDFEVRIRVADIPDGVDSIIIKIEP